MLRCQHYQNLLEDRWLQGPGPHAQILVQLVCGGTPEFAFPASSQQCRGTWSSKHTQRITVLCGIWKEYFVATETKMFYFQPPSNAKSTSKPDYSHHLKNRLPVHTRTILHYQEYHKLPSCLVFMSLSFHNCWLLYNCNKELSLHLHTFFHQSLIYLSFYPLNG